ncbi:MAG TPA: hypothetical protein VFF73_04230, partial [Planctomycetota bacterium]|nr:hypothetical protein [Planctomycetota bacterium]
MRRSTVRAFSATLAAASVASGALWVAGSVRGQGPSTRDASGFVTESWAAATLRSSPATKTASVRRGGTPARAPATGTSSSSSSSKPVRGPSSPAPPLGASFLGLLDDQSSFPPDVDGAVGPNHVMTALNTQVQVQSRSGAIVGPAVSISAFWSSIDPTAQPFDPHVVYDAAAGRWIFTAAGNVQTSSSEILVAVSQTSDPTGSWSKWKFRTDPTGTNWADYDQVGFNRDWIVVTMNLYGVASGNFAESQLFVFQKSLLYAGAMNPSPAVFTTPNFSLTPARTYDAIDTVYTLASVSPNTLQIQSVSGPVTAPTFNPELDVTAPISWDPQGANGADFAPQKGSIQKIDAGDDRIMSLVERGGSLWASHTVFLPAGGPTRSACQWWQVTPGGTILQHGLLDDPTATVFYAYPSLAVNANMDACMGYNAFSATTFASARYTAHLAQDAPGTMRTDALLEAGKASYFKSDGTNNRWGDFSSTVVDPVNDTDFWTLQEYAELPQAGLDAWGTWWGQVLTPVLPSAFVPSSLGTGFTGIFATTP